jgi:hypothetical protein
MAKETLVDDTDSSGAFTIRAFDIFYTIISCCAVYLYTFLIILYRICQLKQSFRSTNRIE